jgi:hypothetical protein
MVKINIFHKTVAIIAILTAMHGCLLIEEGPELDGSVRIINNSEEDIVWCTYSENSDLNPSEFYWENPIKDKFIVQKDSIGIQYFNCDAVMYKLEKNERKYYLFNLDSIQTIPWERICNERIILKEVTFHSWAEMEACDFTITYP